MAEFKMGFIGTGNMGSALARAAAKSGERMLLANRTPEKAEALAAVLQLGVTMDFSIFLLHRYEEEKELASSNEEAMVNAICKTTTSISASSLTTIAGFLALCAMQLTLGRDIGVVMAKGVALGVVCTIVILPSLVQKRTFICFNLS